MTSPKNSNLSAARKAKNDEFYTQFDDITAEINAYLEFDENIFHGKTILLPCDDPDWSAFTKYFATRFTELGIARLISTSYAPGSNPVWQADPAGYHPAAIEKASTRFDAEKTWTNGKSFELVPEDINADGRVDLDDLQWDYLDGDGDFRSAEVTALRDQADFVITNPPFSLFREFLVWLIEGEVKFSIIGNVNAISYKETFPLVRDNRMWLGSTNFNLGMYFHVPPGFTYANTYKFAKEKQGQAVARVAGTCWFTNIEHHKRHEPLQLLTMHENKLLHGDKTSYTNLYSHYDNYDAIEVPRTNAIPSDYNGVMGVPITFLDKYSPEQFEILGSQRWAKLPALLDVYTGNHTPPENDKKTTVDGRETYDRIFIRRR